MWISAAMHAGLLAFIVFGFAFAPKFDDATESIPVDSVTQNQFNEIMKGERDGKPMKEPPPTPAPKPAAEAPPPPPPPPSAPKPVTPQRIRVGGNVQQAKLIRQPKPIYPPLAKQARISGVVRLNAIIGKDGTIQNLTVASGHPLLVPAAMEAVKQWVYQPTLLNGEAVEVVTQIDVNFTLSQ
jgi:TonB family protein